MTAALGYPEHGNRERAAVLYSRAAGFALEARLWAAGRKCARAMMSQRPESGAWAIARRTAMPDGRGRREPGGH